MKKTITISLLFILLFTASLANARVPYIQMKGEQSAQLKSGLCPQGTLLSNLPDGGNAFTSSTDIHTVNYIRIDELQDGSMVEGFLLYGLQAYHDGTGWAQCLNDEMDFEVKFYEAGGDEPGQVIHEEIVSVSVTTSTEVSFGNWTVREFAISLSEAVTFHDGWISVASTRSETCWFLGLSSATGTPNTYYYDQDGSFIQRTEGEDNTPTGVSYCLLGTAGDNDTPDTYSVTFNVDMTGAEGFDPQLHKVFIAADILNWDEPGTGNSVEMTLKQQDKSQAIVIWEEDFESWDADRAGDLPAGWAVYRTASLNDQPVEVAESEPWVANNPVSNPFGGGENPNPDAWKTYVKSGEGSMVIGYTAPEFTWAVSPEIEIPEGHINLEYWTWYTNVGGAGPFPTNYHVAVKTNGVWNIILSQTGQAEESTNNNWEKAVHLNLDEYQENTVRIAFIYEYTDGYQMAIDDVSITKASSGDPSDKIVFTATLGGIEAGEISYKYFSDAFGQGWQGGEWEGEPNRSLLVDGNKTTQDKWGQQIPTSIVENNPLQAGARVFPNPVRHTLFVENVGIIYHVKIFDITGREILMHPVNDYNAAIPVNNLGHGVYILQIVSDRGTEARKISISK